MAFNPSALDWSLIQAYLAVAEHGSLSAAARVLGASQPTLGRQIRKLEEQLGAELFQRKDKGFSLTELGATLLETARSMSGAVHELERRALGKNTELAGTVRITASVMVTTYHLPPIVAKMRHELPHVAIELVPSDETSNLHFREADIAVRMYRPTQLDLVTQHLGDLKLAAFAARSYAEKHGLPQREEEVLAHGFVGEDRGTQILAGFQAAGVAVEREWFGVRSDDPIVLWQLVRAGAGIGFAQKVLGAADPLLVEVPVDFALPLLPIWLTAHEAILQAPRVRKVWDYLAEGLRGVLALPGNH